MDFKKFKTKFQKHVTKMLEGQTQLFTTNTDNLWNVYLNSFPEGTNKIYRERREYDCSCCKQFIRTFGNIVVINDDYSVTSIWDFEAGEFQPVVDALSHTVINDAFITKESGFGTDKNHEQLESGDVKTWEHFRIDLPTHLVTTSHKTGAALVGELRDTKNVFRRSLEEISCYAVGIVLDLIAENSLYRGEEWLGALTKFKELKNEYRVLPGYKRENYCWKKSSQVGGAVGRIRNHSIGTLLTNLTEGMDVLEAVKKFEAIVAPTNYKRPKAIFTKKMVRDAQTVIEGLGLTNSLPRRHATLADVTVRDTLWVNRDAVKHMDGIGGVFESLLQEVVVKPKQFKNIPGMSIKQFMEALSTATRLEVLLENRHEGNLVSLIAPQVKGSPSMFKWNNFSWAYNGNLADSMKERVRTAGGKVDGVIRTSLSWDYPDDLDLHCTEPNGDHIYYGDKRSRSGVNLDVDMLAQYPDSRRVNGISVENITHPNKPTLGIYHYYVHNYNRRSDLGGFSAEIEFGGVVHEFAYNKPIGHKKTVTIAKVKFTENGIEFIESLPSTTNSKTMWGLGTNQFHPVSLVCYSPNYWNEKGIGNRHYLFMLANCVNPDQPNGFYNEFLKEEFMKHQRVFAALGAKMKCEPCNDQLSGLGFSNQRNSLVCRVDNKTIKVIF